MIDRIRASLIAGALLSTVAVAPAHGQEVAEARWLAFVGCWEAVNSDVESGLLCFMPASDGVEMFNVVDGNIASTEILVADGEQRAVSAEGCEGWESIDFSADGRRAFTRSEFVCGEAARSGTGIMAVTAPNQWVDVRSLDVDGEAVAWVQEYRLAGPDRLALEGMSDPVAGIGMAVSTSRRVASAAIDIADVEEAARHVDSKVLETWLAAQQDHFELNGSEIARLADSGVPASVIDVMVAVTYPEKFMVQPTGPVESLEGPRRVIPMASYGGYRGYMGYNPFSMNSRYMYSPYAYYGSGWGYGGGGYWGYQPASVIVDYRPSPQTSGGRAYKGRGYSQGSGGSGSGGAQPRSGSEPSYSSGGNGGSAGSSSGSSGGDSPPPRRAQRRPGGG